MPSPDQQLGKQIKGHGLGLIVDTFDRFRNVDGSEKGTFGQVEVGCASSQRGRKSKYGYTFGTETMRNICLPQLLRVDDARLHAKFKL